MKTLRADHLLTASLAPNLDGLVAAMKAADADASPVVTAKHLGDPTKDLVYTPVTPCRLFDSRGSQGGLGPLTPGVTRTYSVTAPVPQQGGPGGCTAPAGTAVAFIQIAALTPAGPGLIQGGATGTGPFANALVLYQPGGLDGAGVPMPVNTANGRFDMVAQFSGVEAAGDLLGYFIEPEATNFSCVNTGFPSHAIGAGSSTYFVNPACPAGYQATQPYCYTAALGVFSQGSGHVNDGETAQTFCAWHNTTGASQTVYGGASAAAYRDGES